MFSISILFVYVTVFLWIIPALAGITSFLTSIGIFDKFITKYRSGLIIPTTGFAHSVSSSLVDSKKEGLITGLGSNMFILAGSVVLYSTISAFVLVIVKVIILCLV